MHTQNKLVHSAFTCLHAPPKVAVIVTWWHACDRLDRRDGGARCDGKHTKHVIQHEEPMLLRRQKEGLYILPLPFTLHDVERGSSLVSSSSWSAVVCTLQSLRKMTATIQLRSHTPITSPFLRKDCPSSPSAASCRRPCTTPLCPRCT